MQDIREPLRGSTGKSAIANTWAWNWSYLRLQFQHFPHKPDIMTFPSPLLKHNYFFWSSPKLYAALCFKFFDLVIQFPDGIHPLQMGHIIPPIRDPP